MSQFSAEDMIFYKNNDLIMSGGFSVESVLLKNGNSPMYTNNSLNGGDGTRDKVSDIFKNYAVPAGLFYQQNKEKSLALFNYEKMEENPREIPVIPHNIHDTFMNMLESHNNPSSTRSKKTRRIRKVAKNKSKRG